MNIDLPIIILNYKNAYLVREQLRFFQSSQTPFSIELIVVDNASHDDLSSLVRQFPAVRFIFSDHNKGMGAGNNIGIAAAQGNAILILNPDVIVLPGAVTTLWNYLSSHPDVGMVGPRLMNPDGSLQYSCFRFHTMLTPFVRRTKMSFFSFGRKELTRFLMLDDPSCGERSVDWLLGAAVMIRAKALREVGMFDERFFLFLEDTDLCRRFWRKGWKVVYHPGATMIHYPHRLSSSETFTSFFRRVTWIHVASWLKYLWKWRNERRAREC